MCVSLFWSNDVQDIRILYSGDASGVVVRSSFYDFSTSVRMAINTKYVHTQYTSMYVWNVFTIRFPIVQLAIQQVGQIRALLVSTTTTDHIRNTEST